VNILIGDSTKKGYSGRNILLQISVKLTL
jgi:hypothetical protein